MFRATKFDNRMKCESLFLDNMISPALIGYTKTLYDKQTGIQLEDWNELIGAQDIALAEITRHMIDFIGRYT